MEKRQCVSLLRNFCLVSKCISSSVFFFFGEISQAGERKKNPGESNKGFFGNLFKENHHILKKKARSRQI
jgi:hypothetical protein